MTATEKAPASAATLTRAAGLDTTPKPIFIIPENERNFTIATAQNIYEVMCQLLGQQEGVKLVPHVTKRNGVNAG